MKKYVENKRDETIRIIGDVIEKEINFRYENEIKTRDSKIINLENILGDFTSKQNVNTQNSDQSSYRKQKSESYKVVPNSLFHKKSISKLEINNENLNSNSKIECISESSNELKNIDDSLKNKNYIFSPLKVNIPHTKHAKKNSLNVKATSKNQNSAKNNKVPFTNVNKLVSNNVNIKLISKTKDINRQSFEIVKKEGQNDITSQTNLNINQDAYIKKVTNHINLSKNNLKSENNNQNHAKTKDKNIILPKSHTNLYNSTGNIYIENMNHSVSNTFSLNTDLLKKKNNFHKNSSSLSLNSENLFSFQLDSRIKTEENTNIKRIETMISDYLESGSATK